jgi:hypothetical protein
MMKNVVFTQEEMDILVERFNFTMFLHLTFHQKDKVQVDDALIMSNIILEGKYTN